ncbi:MAG: HDOD domain-containing protein [Steroidobacteraceae bacterium]|jgi:HD-like signal output (HDOD) protein
MPNEQPLNGATRTAASHDARIVTPQERAGALEFLQGLSAEMAAGKVNLPCFPDVVLRIRRALANPQTQISQTVKIVGTEPRLAARILQTANSAVFNVSGKPVADLRTAVTRLGTRLVQSSAMAFAVQQMRMAPVLKSVGVQLKELWEESISAATLCQLLARRTTVNPDEAFLTGLLHGIGRLYIMVRAASDPGKARYERSLLELIDGWHPAIGQLVLQNWGFPEAMAAAVGEQQNYGYISKVADQTDIIIAGLVLAAAARPGGERIIEGAEIKPFGRLGLRAEECRAMLAVTARHIGALRGALGC